MKKMIIAAAIAAGALVSQGATFNWGTSGKAYSIDATTMAAGLAAGQTYGVGSNNASSMYNQISTYSAVWTYAMTLTSGETSVTLDGTIGSGNFDSRAINITGLSSGIWDGATGDAPVTVNYSIVITGTVTDGADKTWTITSDAIVGSKQYAGVGDINIQSAGPTQWSTTAVPEPTSGLLMLLGMAGLALKRRRA